MSAPGFTGPGWSLEPISITTGGRVQPGLFFENLAAPVVPPNLGSPVDAVAQQYGVDHLFPLGFYVVDGSGNLVQTQQYDGLLGAILRSLVTNPGEIPWQPSYGMGLVQSLNLNPTASVLSQLKTRIRATLLGQFNVASVDRLDLSMTGHVMFITIGITILRQTFLIQLVLRKTA